MLLHSNRRSEKAHQARDGMATLELVMATAIGFPIFVTLLYWGIHACRALFSIIGSMIGSPLM